MEPSCIFRLTRTSLHQIPDLSEYFKLDFGARARERAFDASRAPSPRDDVNSSHRLSRSSSRAFSSNRMSHHTRHHSLIAMRTHYAYGARSASLSSSNSGRYYSNASSRYTPNEPVYKSSYDPSPALNNSRSSYAHYRTLPFSSTPSSSPITYGRKSYYPPTTNSSTLPRLSYSPSSNYIKSYATDKHSNSLSRTYRTRAASPIYKTHTRLSPVPTTATEVPAVEKPTPECRLRTPEAPPLERSIEKEFFEKYVQTEKCEDEKPPVRSVERSTSDLDEAQSELQFLRIENERLRKEVSKLNEQLKDKERLDIENKRKLLETEAELKVWRSKYELSKPTVVEIREPPPNGLPSELMDQLDSAADRLHKLNAVKDLKLLQKEMESALLEIAHK
ncbi:hypothetical protein QR680_001968 [Steinernema hermaphroditum]|uniref:Uncharacterized protein n=1 Tax=Steinernema hermaphroditum TaxID=289476 RepID=A0AA39H0P4_9BILA|nr:hypothetical protein QR680_001968 [Steinernema hermaphroditum]